jgi:hypothetical protein
MSKGFYRGLEHVFQKWKPVLGKRHAKTKLEHVIDLKETMICSGENHPDDKQGFKAALPHQPGS